MKRLKILILIFCTALSIPLGYFVLRTYWSLKQEEISELRYFAVALFDQMEEELASFVFEEESRPVDEYKYNYNPSPQISDSDRFIRSPLSQPPRKPYILGYLQNDPDGSFQTPLVENDEAIPPERTDLVAQLNEVNKVFNQKKTSASKSIEAKPSETLAKRKREEVATFADKYLDPSRSKKKQRAYLGQEKSRVEEITSGRAVRIARRDQQELEKKKLREPNIQSE